MEPGREERPVAEITVDDNCFKPEAPLVLKSASARFDCDLVVCLGTKSLNLLELNSKPILSCQINK